MEMLKRLIVHTTAHGACVKSRFAAILIALCLLVGIVGFSSSLSGVLGIPADESTPPPDTTTVPPTDSPATGPSGAGGTTWTPASADTGATPVESPTEYIEQDPVVLPDAPSPPATSRATIVATPVVTESPEQIPSRAPGSAPTVTDGGEADPSTGSAPARVTVRLVARDDAFTPSSITVPAGSQVTIVLENEDVDIPHNVVVYADRDAPLFVGTIVKGPGRTTDTFTAPSEPGKYVLGCCMPSTHRMGAFVVE